MRTRLIGAVGGLVMCLGVAACGGGDDGRSSEPAGTQGSAGAKQLEAPSTLAKEGEFSACMDISFPPMEYYADQASQTPAGFDVDLVKAIAERWGVKPVFRSTDFAGLLPALASGRCDVVWSAILILPERTKRFSAVPYYDTARVLLVRGGNPEGINTPEDLAGKTVAAETGTDYIKQLNKLAEDLAADGKAKLNVQGYPKQTDALQQVVVGRADGVMTQDTEAGFRAKQQPGQFETAYRFPGTETFGAYHQKSNTELGRAVREALATLMADGALDEVAEANGLPTEGLSAVEAAG